MLGAAPLNTQSFLSFQIVQAPRIMREFRPFLVSPSTVKAALSQQSSKEGTSGYGASAASPTICRSSNLNCLANTQPMSRWWMFSCSTSHNIHRSGWVRPVLAFLSTITRNGQFPATAPRNAHGRPPHSGDAMGRRAVCLNDYRRIRMCTNIPL